MTYIKYLSPKYCNEIHKGALMDDSISYVGTYSDILFIGDEFKVASTHEQYVGFKRSLELGNIFLVELDEQWFVENAFEEDGNGGFMFDENVNSTAKGPLFTCNYLSLKSNCASAYWDNEILEEFTDIF